MGTASKIRAVVLGELPSGFSMRGRHRKFSRKLSGHCVFIHRGIFMAVTRKNFLQLTALHAVLAFSTAVSAGTVVVKPGTYVGNSEFGSAVARLGNYTLVGAFQETVAIPGEDILGGGIGGQGVVYLFNGTNSNPERRY